MLTALLVQPPLTQLNGPYPAIYYLRAFFNSRGFQAEARDHSIGLFERIFCPEGLAAVFAEARRRTIRQKDMRGFISEEGRWLNSITGLTAFLRGRDREWGHLLALGNGALPGGPRFNAALARMERPPPDNAQLLASKLLADLADFITAAADSAFSLVRYGPRITGNQGLEDFSSVKAALDGFILRAFYGPLLEDEWNQLEASLQGGPFILGLSIPFPGCLAGALFCAASAKRRFGARVTVLAGGGYVNTDLRALEAAEFFDYIDYLCFDRGYGAAEAVLGHISPGGAGEPELYKTMYRSHRTGGIIRGLERQDGDLERLEDEAAASVFPDYSGLDFSRYLYPLDDANPMHRLWSDGHWLKAYLAHGCYWHRCAFCDTELDYIRCFRPLDPARLFRHLRDQAEKTGLRGVHLVDEAAPASSLLALAELNREAGLPLVFWGNIRFDRAFSPDTAAILAAGGLLGVSGGIEIAAPDGFRRLGKGIGLADVVRVCAAFKEQGILTHGYLIYGYWDQGVQEIIDSAEIVRQLFAEGLLDSAFWHQFVLTRHSRLYAEWLRGLHPRLKAREPEAPEGRRFALNDCHFEGEEGFSRFAEPLDRLLAAWMAGDTGPETLAAHLRSGAFSRKAPRPSVAPLTVTALLDEYAQDRDRERERALLPDGQAARRALFLGSRPLVSAERGSALFWRWRTADHRLPLRGGSGVCGGLGALLERASHCPGVSALDFYRDMEKILGADGAGAAWKALRCGGLALAAGALPPHPRHAAATAGR